MRLSLNTKLRQGKMYLGLVIGVLDIINEKNFYLSCVFETSCMTNFIIATFLQHLIRTVFHSTYLVVSIPIHASLLYEKALHTNILSGYHINSHLKFKTLLPTNMQIFYGHCSQEDIVFNLRRYLFCLQIFQPWKVDKYAAIHIWNPKNMMHIFLFVLNKYYKSWP